MGASCGGGGINWDCLTGVQVGWIIGGIFGGLFLLVVLALLVAGNIVYLREKLAEGKRFALRSPWGFEDKPKTKKITTKKGSSNLLTWVLVILIVLAIVIPTTALIASR